ncbi:MAG: 4-hydroxy-3-methylbut-2-enyl diphosphate reductase [Treponema sp.]|nr:4-hydroxy-3-methylbut-2-enyl diphosphate reductase [Treponema sp.]
MKVVRAKVLGFCMGVRRAVEMAGRASAGQGVYTLGPLIHNPTVLQRLAERGIAVLQEGDIPPDPENATVIVRAHGVPRELETELRRRGVRILDATCPNVKLSQIAARSFAERGFQIFLAGEENHGEISGIRGYVDSPCYVLGNPEDAEKAGAELSRLQPDAITALIAQTTISASEYIAIGERLLRFFPDIGIVNTICNATAERQEALRELCGEVDAVVVAGGQESANTRRLLSLAEELGKPAWLIESQQEIPGKISAELAAYETVGLTAGASTPDSLIAEIEAALTAL